MWGMIVKSQHEENGALGEETSKKQPSQNCTKKNKIK
jgi:hypothetical protein